MWEAGTACHSLAPGFIPGFWWDRVARLFSFPCCVFCFVLFDFVLCLVFTMLPVSLDCSFLITPSVLSSVYLNNDWIILQLVSIDRTFIFELLITCISRR